MIAVVTHRDDVTADYIITGLRQKGLHYRRFNTEEILDEDEGSIELTSHGITSPIWKNVRKILFRRTKLPDYKSFDSGTRRFLEQQSRSLLDNLWAISEGQWISHPISVYRAENKLLQLKKAIEVGLSIPHTLVSADTGRIKRFWKEEQGEVCVKPLKNVRLSTEIESLHLYTNRVTASDLDRLDESIPSPAIYQREVVKAYELRITIVGDQCFAARVDSQNDQLTELDWRRGKAKFDAVDLSVEIAQKYVALTRLLGLSFGAIDVAVTPSGEHIFFEINPVGQFVWIELQTGMPITNSLIELLRQ